MMNRKRIIIGKRTLVVFIFLAGCSDAKRSVVLLTPKQTIRATMPEKDTPPSKTVLMVPGPQTIETGATDPAELLRFAKTLIGVPYLYASTDPAKGLDCSGFVTYVFNHFNIIVPRSSVDFTHIGKEINCNDAGPGDLILFTGTDSAIHVVGHMGIVESNKNDSLQFIHSSSGKAKGVVITLFGNYYKSRFVKVIRIFPDRYFEQEHG